MKRIIIVGAGILGASAAYYLAKNGAEVVIVDRNDNIQATDAAAGMICPWISQRRNKAWYELAKEGARLYPELVQELEEMGETETGFSQVGALSLHQDEDKMRKMEERARKRRADAPEIGKIELLDEQETKEQFPLLADGFRSVYISGAARVDGKRMRHALIRAAEKYGAAFIKGNAELIHSGGKLSGCKVNEIVLEADIVIAANGAWMKELLLPLNIHFAVAPQKGQILHVQLPNMETSKWPVVLTPTSQLILSFADRLVIGSTHEDTEEFDSRPTIGAMYEILNKILPIAPGLINSSLLQAKVGFRPVTPNFLPVIGNIPGLDNLLIANGLGSSGLTMGPFVGKQLANLALGKEIEIDLAEYNVAGALK
ncbi:MAG TPA: FAD-dependent oxidoreductase [Bacillota bacterium]|nr:FAD-dependent oxidoreductase [Bacillota bacterium]